MDTLLKICYPTGHETPWQRRCVGEAQAESHCVAPIRQDLSGCRCRGRLLSEFGGAVVSGLPEARKGGTPSPANPRSPSAPVLPREKTTGGDSAEGGAGAGLSDRPLDSEAGGPGGREAVWDSLLDSQSVEADGEPGMELPEARNAGAGEGRGGDCPLETLRLASYKKRPKDLAPISPSSMKAGSCWFPTSFAPGPLAGRRRSCELPGGGDIKSPPSPRLRSLPNAKSSHSMPDSIETKTSAPRRWPSSFGICSSTCADRLCCSGMTVLHTKARRPSNSSSAIRDCMSTAFPVTPPNSTRRNSSGPISSAPWPTAFLKMTAISNDSFTLRSNAFASPRACFGHALRIRNCHGTVYPLLSKRSIADSHGASKKIIL